MVGVNGMQVCCLDPLAIIYRGVLKCYRVTVEKFTPWVVTAAVKQEGAVLTQRQHRDTQEAHQRPLLCGRRLGPVGGQDGFPRL